MNKPTYIILHCSDSSWGHLLAVRSWHTMPKPKGRGWEEVGYHFIIDNAKTTPDDVFLFMNGSVEVGRDIDKEGAHCIGYNDRSISICLIGKEKEDFRIEQFDTLKKMLIELCRTYHIPAENVLGHGETESGKAEGKTCPNFSVADIRAYLKGRI